MIIEIEEIIHKSNAEIEDLIPIEYLEKSVDKLFKEVEDEAFIDEYDNSKSFLPQVNTFAEKHNISLPNGFKVDIARLVKQRMEKNYKYCENFKDFWIELFNKINK